MASKQTKVYFRFPNTNVCEDVLTTFFGPGAIQSDGNHEGIAYDIDILGGTGSVPTKQGFHVNMVWRAPEYTFPEELGLYRVFPKEPFVEL